MEIVLYIHTTTYYQHNCNIYLKLVHYYTILNILLIKTCRAWCYLRNDLNLNFIPKLLFSLKKGISHPSLTQTVLKNICTAIAIFTSTYLFKKFTTLPVLQQRPGASPENHWGSASFQRIRQQVISTVTTTAIGLTRAQMIGCPFLCKSLPSSSLVFRYIHCTLNNAL